MALPGWGRSYRRLAPHRFRACRNGLGWRVELARNYLPVCLPRIGGVDVVRAMGSSDHDGSELDARQAALRAAFTQRRGWVEAMGLEIVELTAEVVTAEWNVEDRHLQPHGIVHGGVYASVVETCCSVGAALAAPPDKIVVGVENHTSFVRPVQTGRLTARATPLHAGRRAQLWECTISDAAARLIATGRVRVMCVDAEREK